MGQGYVGVEERGLISWGRGMWGWERRGERANIMGQGVCGGGGRGERANIMGQGVCGGGDGGGGPQDVVCRHCTTHASPPPIVQ